jgi:predicted adenine nucleotide alpha hydrolase (AANH) superfamily ATPase
MIKEWEKSETKPSILLHSCCAPCSTYTLEYMTQFAEITIYFANSNIHPREEYERRLLVQKKFVEDFNEATNQQVGFLAGEYEPSKFVRMVKEKGLIDETL